jgi:hypothetical protein
MKRYSQAPTRQVQVTSPVAPTEAVVSGGVGLPPPTAEVGSVGAEKVGQFVSRAEQRGAPVINELPPIFKPAGFADNGEQLFSVDGGKTKMRKSDILNKLGRQ